MVHRLAGQRCMRLHDSIMFRKTANSFPMDSRRTILLTRQCCAFDPNRPKTLSHPAHYQVSIMRTWTTGLRFAFIAPIDCGHGLPQCPVSPLPCSIARRTVCLLQADAGMSQS